MRPQAVLHDVEHGSLLFVLSGTGTYRAQMAVGIDVRGRGKDKKKAVNHLISGYMARPENLRARLKGRLLELLLGSLDDEK